MKTTMDILRISAGKIESNGQLYANAIIIDGDVSDTISPERIDVGQQHAKVKISTDDNNELAIKLAKSGLIPGRVEVEIKTAVKGGEATIQITNFIEKKVA